MFNLKTLLLGLLVAASVIASFMVYSHGEAVFQARSEIFRQQSEQLNSLQAEQRRLAESLAHPATSAGPSHSADIAKLRAEADALRKQTNELAARRNSSRATPSQSQNPAAYGPEYLAKLREARSIRGAQATFYAQAILDYAWDHQKQLPTSLDQVASYLKDSEFSVNGTNFIMPASNHLEIIFQGSIGQLEGIPNHAIAVVRDNDTWLSPDGKPTRVYGMMDGSGQTVSSDDNFQSWEAEHVIPAPASGTR